ncbi:hypothetical protein D5086_023339 [Populus alba]|uniref:Uncharacterized protein n=1 Tax=Populus alba TaxID=43335 RepID=A0ACC4BBB0_POPAL
MTEIMPIVLPVLKLQAATRMSFHDERFQYKKMEACVTPHPETDEVTGAAWQPFSERLNAVPSRISSGSIPGLSVETFLEDSRTWKKHVNAYKRINNVIDSGRYRNIMDMNAGMGGFAAALQSPKLWVMNVMPTINERDTLGVIYERGLIGIYHDWCEAFSTYPRTYDLIHANGVFSLYKDKCNMEDILLEMDRILRPEGAVIFRDKVDVLIKAKTIALHHSEQVFLDYIREVIVTGRAQPFLVRSYRLLQMGHLASSQPAS